MRFSTVTATRFAVAVGSGAAELSSQHPMDTGPAVANVAPKASGTVPSRTESGPEPTRSVAETPTRGPVVPGPRAWHVTSALPVPCRTTSPLNAYLPAGRGALDTTVVAVSAVVAEISTGIVLRASKPSVGLPGSPFAPGGPWNPRSPRGPRGPRLPLGPLAEDLSAFPTRTTLLTVFSAAFPSGVVPSKAITSAAAERTTARRCTAP